MNDLEKVLEKFYYKIRNDDYNNIYHEPHPHLDVLINEYYNFGVFIPNKRYLCYIKSYLNDESLFKENIKKYTNYKHNTWRYKEERICLNCDLECNEQIHPHFEFFAAVFVLDIENRINFFSNKEKKEMTIIFFKQFYEIDGELRFNEDRMMDIIISYDFQVIEKMMLKNNTITNIISLIAIKDFYETFRLKFKNLDKEMFKKLKIQEKFIKNKLQAYRDIYEIEKELKIQEDSKPNEQDKWLEPLQSIWLATAKISIEDFLKIGIENQLWDENYNLLTKRKSLYGSGKNLLSSIAVALKNYAISDEIRYDFIGRIFCKTFNIDIDKNTKQPFKSFSSANPKYTKEIKRLYKI
jgi:hypothetical protein